MAPDIGNGGQPGALTPEDDWAQSRSSQALNGAVRMLDQGRSNAK
jgi:hypothetical protein